MYEMCPLAVFLSSLPLLWTAWSHGSLRADKVQRKDESTSDSELRLLLFSITVMQLTHSCYLRYLCHISVRAYVSLDGQAKTTVAMTSL